MRDFRLPDAIIVGGGVLGCACALRLAESGLTVILVERDAIASHASGNAYGGLYPTFGPGIPGPSLPVAIRSVELHRELDPPLQDETGIDIGLREAPSIELALTPEDMIGLFDASVWWPSQGFDFKMLDRQHLLEIEPAITPEAVGGVLHNSHYEVDSYRFTLALATAFERRGGRIRSGAVAGLEREGDRVGGVVLESGEVLQAGVVVIASGPWAGQGEIDGLPDLPIRPVKGEIIRLRYPGTDLSHRVVVGRSYVARKPGGLVWIGTTDEEAGFDEKPTFAARDEIFAGALAIAPGLESAEIVEHTACLRPTSADGLPVVGPVADGAIVANGAGSKGILLSHAIAEFVREIVTGEEASVAMPAEYDVGRFL